MSPNYQYSIGEIIQTYDNQYGIITDKSNAYEYMAFEKNVTDATIRSYSHIAIYKVLMDGKISYVNESNIKGIVSWEKEKQ